LQEGGKSWTSDLGRMEEPRARVVFLLLGTILVCLHVCTATEYDHKYAVGDTVMLWVNKVGPYNNPQETYNYYSLPFCKPGKGVATHKWGGLGEVLEGNELIDSEIRIKFRSK
jgi:transmembrane 9 superfamily protein 3